MAGKRFLTQLEILINSTLGNPETGYLGIGAKSEGLFMKTPSDEYLILTSLNVRNDVRAVGAATNDAIVSEAGIRNALEDLQYEPPIQLQGPTLVGRRDETIGGWSAIRVGANLEIDSYGSLNCTVVGGSGTVTSVGLSMPNIFSVSGSPVTGSGTLTASLISQTKNKVLASPASASGVPVFRALVAEDIPDL